MNELQKAIAQLGEVDARIANLKADRKLLVKKVQKLTTALVNGKYSQLNPPAYDPTAQPNNAEEQQYEDDVAAQLAEDKKTFWPGLQAT